MRRVAPLFFVIALIYVAPGFLPGRTFAPLDLPLDSGAWKADPAQRVRVSNSLLSDVITQFIPWEREARRLIARGEAPFVNRFAGEGGTLYADPGTGLLSPFTWPRLLFDLDGWAISALLKLLAAALSAFWLARELDVARREAVVSALVFATAGNTVLWLLWPHTNVSALLPAFAAASLRLMKQPRLRNAALAILFAALCTAGGHPETLFVGVVGIFVFLIWEALRTPTLGLGALVPVSVGALLGFLLLFVQLVPFFAVLGESYAGAERPGASHSFRAWAVAGQVLPGILGSPARGELDLTVFAKGENFNLRNAAYIGALTLLALLVSFRSLVPPLRRGLVIGAVALVLSWYPPGVWEIARHVPVLRVVALEYGSVLFVMFGSIAAGPALAQLASRPRKKIGVFLIVVGLGALIVGSIPALAPSLVTRTARAGIAELRARGHLQQAPEVYEQRLAYYLDAAGNTALRRVAVPGALWLLAGIALLAPIRRRELVVFGAAIGELIAFGAGYNPAVRMTDVPPEPGILRAVKQRDPSRQYLIAAPGEFFPANLGTLYGVRDVVAYDALTSKRRVEELRAAGYDPRLHSLPPAFTPEQLRALEALGVRFVLTRAGIQELPNAPPSPLPVNRGPRGIVFGAIVSLLAAVAAAAWLRLYTLPPVTQLPLSALES